MSVLRSIPILLFASFLVIACQNNSNQSPALSNATNPTQGIKVIADTSVQATVRKYVSTLWCGKDLSGAAFIRASNIYRYKNCDEVQETLEIPEVMAGLDDSGNTVAGAFLRYSIGTKVFREVLWFRKVGDTWAQTTEYPSSYSDEEDWNREALNAGEEADSWEENSAEWYE